MEKLKNIFICISVLLFFNTNIDAQNKVQTFVPKKENTISANLKWSERMALSIMKRYPEAWKIDNVEKLKLDYKQSFALISFEHLYAKTNRSAYNGYIKGYADAYIDSSGFISHYELQDYNIDLLNTGKLLFDLYKTTQDKRYFKAMQLLRKQLDGQPKTLSGGFWHKKIYPDQMWLDGLYMGTPFYTRYTVEFDNGKDLNVIAKQFELVQAHFFNSKTGLPFHAWDESGKIAWAKKDIGTSPTSWSRATGWYAMALVDVLDYYPKEHPKHKELVLYLNQLAQAVSKYQDKSGLWFQVTDAGTREGNYLEASGSAMFAYVFAKGVNKGYLPKEYTKIADKAFEGLLEDCVKVDQDGEVHLGQVSLSIGLGGSPFRDGSYKYYTEGKTLDDNSIGVGAFILAALELNK